MRIFVTIDNILRDHISKLKFYYENTFNVEIGDDINPYDLYVNFPSVQAEVNEIDYSPDKEIDLIENTSSDINFDVYNFIYNEASFEIFGRSDESVNGIINKLSTFSNDNDIEIILVNKDTVRSKCATLFFLSKNNFNMSEILFKDNWSDFWLGCDILVTDNPKIIKCKPDNTNVKLIKVENKFNIDYKSDYTIFNINEIFELINKLK